MKIKAIEIANWLRADGQHMSGVTLSGTSIDSRTVKEGDLFIPFRGEHVNGHQYVESAIKSGAAASFWMKDEPNPPKDIPLIFVDDPEIALQETARAYRDTLQCTVIGITGSNGKTSTKDLIASALSPYFNIRKTEGNYNNELGLPLTILSLDEQTEYAVLEMGMSGFGEISFLSKLAKPDYVVITNIGEAHMLDLGSREGIAKAKFEIVDGLAKGGKLYYDGDEPLLRTLTLTAQHADFQAFSFGYAANNDISLKSVDSNDNGSSFTTSGLESAQFTIPVYGAHQVKNTLAAVLIAKEADLSTTDIAEALKSAELTDMRMQPIQVKNGALFINDAYNAAPTSVKAALSFIKKTNLRPKKWLVLGDMLELGAEEQLYHESLAEQIVDMDLEGILLYGPRMKWLHDELQKHQKRTRLVWSKDDYQPITDVIQAETDTDSVILVKGSRGMALENIIQAITCKDDVK